MRHRLKWIGISFVFVFIFSLPFYAFAQEELAPEWAKLATDDAGTVGKGGIEIEFGYTFNYAKKAMDNDWHKEDRGILREHEFGLSIAYGILDNLDISADTGYANLYDHDSDPEKGEGFCDLGLGIKYRFLKLKSLDLELAYITSLSIPTGRFSDSHRLGPSDEFWAWENKIALSRDFGKLTMNMDFGFSLPFGKYRENERGTLSYDLAVGYQIVKWLQPEIEINYEHGFVKDEDDNDSIFLTAGFIMPLTDHFKGKVGLQQTVTGRNTDYTTSIILALTLSF
ncbi:MAG: hypothetical protein DRG20_05680 [Deltaproteobacteria bacterium]|nr:MAG: hypothetical protein DRG20_05680 [Deltaproteobacteria bacterium]